MNLTSKTILIVDDDRSILENMAGYFNEKGWDVLKAAHGEAAIQILKERKWSCNCIILDQLMPRMDGLTFLKSLRMQEPHNIQIPVIVLSAYVDSDSITVKSFKRHGTSFVLRKPQDPALLEVVANAIIVPTDPHQVEQNIKREILAHEINTCVQENEELIEHYYKSRMSKPSPIFQTIEEPLFVVARRWNSWYPSFFDVLGGAYATVFPSCNSSRRNRAAVIDPGFRFLKILTDEFGMSVEDLETCIISHNHPDHLAGIFEYIACRLEADKATTFHCNPSIKRMLAELAGPKVTPLELPGDGKEGILLSDYLDSKDIHRSLSVRTFPTDHRAAGGNSDSLGLILECHAGVNCDEYANSFKTVILGDSTFDEANPDMGFLSKLANEKVKIAVLHIGSAQLKRRVGGHLYLTGLGRLLLQLASTLETLQRNKNNKLVVLVSEWGLEHATAEQIEAICPNLKGFEKTSSIIATINFLRSRLRDFDYDRLTLLPADIGLMVGMETGMVYLKKPNGKLRRLSAEQLKFKAATTGLEYY